MNGLTQVIAVEPAANGNTLAQRFFKICYLTAISVSTVGWLAAFSWMTVRIAKWLLA